MGRGVVVLQQSALLRDAGLPLGGPVTERARLVASWLGGDMGDDGSASLFFGHAGQSRSMPVMATEIRKYLRRAACAGLTASTRHPAPVPSP